MAIPVRIPLIVTLMAALAGGACRGERFAADVIVRVEREASVPRPAYLRLDWLGPHGYLVKDRRIDVAANGAVLATIALASEASGEERRAVIVRGLLQDRVVGEAAAVVEVGGARVDLSVVLEANRLADQDADGLPDIVDICPAAANTQNCPPHAPVDGPPAASDAGSPDSALPLDGPATPLPTPDAGPEPDGPPRDATIDVMAPPPIDGPTCPVANGDRLLWDFEDGHIERYVDGTRSSASVWIRIAGSLMGQHSLIVAPDSRCQTRSLQYTASGFAGWGSGISGTFLPPLTTGEKKPLDARGYRGLRLVMRTTTPDKVFVKLAARPVAGAAATCTSCFFVADVESTDGWREVLLPFPDLALQSTSGPRGMLDPASLLWLELIVGPGRAHDLRVDTISLYR